MLSGTVKVNKITMQVYAMLLFTVISNANNVNTAYQTRMTHSSMNIAFGPKTYFFSDAKASYNTIVQSCRKPD